MNETTSQTSKQILALDGGGVRGVLSVAFLERIEQLLEQQTGSDSSFRLSDHFHLIGGTSTGAIIAALLALGYRASEIRELYFKLARGIFRRRWYRVKLFQSVFDARLLKSEVDRIMGDVTLDSQALLTSLAIITKRMDTGSTWIVTNNPRAKYWDDPDDGSYIGNRHYRLADLVRASTAAPYYFAPHQIRIAEGEPPGLFVDGGVSPHNNPALALFEIATIPAFGFGWPTGRAALHVVSVGTGTFRDNLSHAQARRMPALGLAVQALKSMVKDSGNEVMTLMQALGHTDTPWHINSELGDLAGVLIPPEPLFTFQRYDTRLEQDWLKQQLGIELTGNQVNHLFVMEDPGNIDMLYEIGQAAAEKFIHSEHLRSTGHSPDT